MNSIKDQATREPLPHHLPCQNREMGDCVGVPGVEEKNKHSRVTPTGGAVLRDGTFLELVRNRKTAPRGCFSTGLGATTQSLEKSRIKAAITCRVTGPEAFGISRQLRNRTALPQHCSTGW